MSIQTTDAKHVALFDTVTGIAFGPVFDDVPEADAFVRWWEAGSTVEGQSVAPYDLRLYHDLKELVRLSFSSQKAIADKWRAFLVEHPEPECPWDIDRDSYGIGFRGDDYSCECPCHRREGGVFSGR